MVFTGPPEPSDLVSFAAARKGATGIAKRATIVIGENMEKRVILYAKKIGANWYRARRGTPVKNWMKNNREALRTWMQKGKKIIDIGPDKLRRKKFGPSENYEMERRILNKNKYPVTWDPQ